MSAGIPVLDTSDEPKAGSVIDFDGCAEKYRIAALAARKAGGGQ